MTTTFDWKRHLRSLTTVIGLLALSVILSIMSPVFLTADNITNVITQCTVNAIVALGMTVVVITGGIDLSVGSVLAVAGIVMAMLLKSGYPVPLAMFVCLVIGAFCGLLNGIMITRGKLPPFIATLGMMSMARGIALVISNGRAISSFGPGLRFVGIGQIGGIPVQILVMVVLYIIIFYLLRYREFGRYIYAIGGNEETTRLSGVNVRRYKTLAYMLCGAITGCAAIVLTAKLNSAQPIAGTGYELDAIAAAVIGGTSLSGGVGKVQGTIIGAIIMSVLRNGLNLLNASSYWQQFIIGLVIVGAVLMDTLQKKD
ncbi:MAG: ABC transporter permease [Planctomycetes bacterium]|nr:ABC transporter permease [Planctomycetota bacterium]